MVVAMLVIVIGGAVALGAARNRRAAAFAGASTAVAGSVLGLGVSVRALFADQTWQVRWDWNVPYGEIAFGIDPLSSFFLILLFALTAVTAAYGALDRSETFSGGAWFFFNVMVAAIALVLTARNGVLFLIAWEVMALASFFLITMDHRKRQDVRIAGRTYIVATHIGTALLLVMFALLGSEAGSLDFDDFGRAGAVPGATASAVFLLALGGFGSKAGLVPFHVWMPEAYSAAPGHAAALIAGVMSKIGIYGLLRVLTFLDPYPAWWGVALIVVGLVSGLFGILFAMAQEDFRRLLAYSSIENLGIVTLAVGVGVWGASQGLPIVALPAFAGALMHVAGHATVKALLFMVASAVYREAKSLDMDRLGGLMKRMPATGVVFLVGAASIAGLPPLGGFAGEFLIVLGGYRGILAADTAQVAVLAVSIAGIGLIGGLAALTFAKAFGMMFLGSSRTDAGLEARDPRWRSLAPAGLLAIVLVAIGVFAPFFVRIVIPAAAPLAGVG
ncbi:MAG: proton-conducting transporter membrane subunit, partial [Chloroflexi bacterium]|nr:proton-conducting transporter membrane subunit [Chloroflexota bacterium]